MKHPIGTTYKRRYGKIRQDCTVIDYYTTKNLAGDIVKRRYVTAHDFMGSTLVDYDVTETEISRCLSTAPGDSGL